MGEHSTYTLLAMIFDDFSAHNKITYNYNDKTNFIIICIITLYMHSGRRSNSQEQLQNEEVSV